MSVLLGNSRGKGFSMTPFEIFLVTLNAALFGGFVFEEIRLRSKNAKLVESIVKLTLDKITLQKQAVEDVAMSPAETEGFIKFLSESREWAFQYIEDVQSSIEELKVSMDSDDTDKIDQAYKKLITFLPEKMNND